MTERETQVLLLISEGVRDKEIARQLGISPHTVNSHVKKIFRKLAVRSRAQAVSVALQRKLI